jgi:arsenate reductase
MREVGVDLSGQRPKSVQEFLDADLDYVITVCHQANESCPVFPRPVDRIHVDFEDPPQLAVSATTEDERLAHYRKVRDEIRRFVEALPDRLGKATPRAAR